MTASASTENPGKWHWFLLGISFGILVFFSCFRLTESPPIWFDEGLYTQIGANIALYGHQSLQVAPQTLVPTSFITVGYPLLLPLAAAYKLFGVGTTQGRAVMVLFIVGLAVLSYALIRRLHGTRAALLATLILATFPMLYGNGKTVIGEVPGVFFLIATIFSLTKLEAGGYKDWRWYGAVGLFAALCAATKPIYLLLLPALFLVYLLQFKKIQLTLKGTLFGIFALMAPLALWIFLQFGNTSLSTIVSSYANPSAVQNIHALMLHNARRLVTESTPLYTMCMLAVWGVALVIRRKHKTISAGELAAFYFSVFIIFSYLRLEGWYRYLFPATLVAIPFLPHACITVFDEIKHRVSFASKFNWLPYAFLILLCVGQLYQTARTSFAAEFFNSTRTHDMTEKLARINETSSVFLYNAPELAILLPSSNYYQYAKPSATQMLGENELDALRHGKPDLVLVTGSDLESYPDLFGHYEVTDHVGNFDLMTRR